MLTSKRPMPRLIWLAGSIIIILSFYLPYIYGNSLIDILDVKIPLIFGILTNLSMTSLVALIAGIGFFLATLGGVLSLVFSAFAYQESRLWKAPKGIRIWNASWLSFVGLILLSVPVFVYLNGTLIRVVSIIDLQYWPILEGLNLGYILTWIGVLSSLLSGRLVLRQERT